MVVKITEKLNAVAGQSVLRGIISEIRSDGLIAVDISNNNDQTYLCEFLQSGDQSINLSSGDIVLLISPDSTSPLGCIIGKVGRYSPTNEPTTPEIKQNRQLKKIESDQIEIQAGSKLVLKCGKGSLSINEDGTIIVKGSRLLSRSSGINKIKGAAVQIN
ncbi:MAG: hypothetical protein P1R58_13450 [bacterium]|nr:hypothetical protein [bacterium]